MKLSALSVFLSGVRGSDEFTTGTVFPRGRPVGGVLGLGLPDSRGPKKVAFDVRELEVSCLEEGRDVLVEAIVGVGVSRESAELVLKYSAEFGDSTRGAESTRRMVEGGFSVGRLVKIGAARPGQVVTGIVRGKPVFTQGRIVYFNCGMSVARSARTKRGD